MSQLSVSFFTVVRFLVCTRDDYSDCSLPHGICLGPRTRWHKDVSEGIQHNYTNFFSSSRIQLGVKFSIFSPIIVTLFFVVSWHSFCICCRCFCFHCLLVLPLRTFGLVFFWDVSPYTDCLIMLPIAMGGNINC